jgi:RNA polymerase sigma factor (sigma-70 family)
VGTLDPLPAILVRAQRVFSPSVVSVSSEWQPRACDSAVDARIDVPVTALAEADFDAFYAATYREVLVLATALMGDRDRGADVAQDAFVAARRRWATVSGYDRPDLWVRRVAVNRAISWRRKAANELRALARLPRRPESPDFALPDDQLWREVAKLPRRQAQVIALVYVDDLTVEQAAAVLGVAVSTAKTHLHRGRAALAAALADRQEDP